MTDATTSSPFDSMTRLPDDITWGDLKRGDRIRETYGCRLATTSILTSSPA
ncbi:hypothetical protein [Thermobispora bispora]|uniref:hypothetical protein n=1 Tax=Thermobispora bispora TaxID=2006 RepID=UPI00197F5504|nr:hypothetical protein [Thermobispora bispora]